MESLTLRPVVNSWAVAPDQSVVVGRDAGRPEIAVLPTPSRAYQRLVELPLPAHHIAPAAAGRLWLRCWPAKITQRARARPFGRELLVLAPDGTVLRLLTMEGALAQLLAAGPLMLVAAVGGTLHAFDADGRLRWRHPVPGWPATPEPRVWSDEDGARIWVAEAGGISELDGSGALRWSADLPASLAPDPVSQARRRQAAELLGVAIDASARQLRRAFHRRAKETHPDHHPDEPRAAERFRAVAGAYRALREASPGGNPHESGLLRVSDAVAAGQEGVWVGTSSGSWHRFDGRGREVEQGQLRRGGPAVLAVDSAGQLVAAGCEGELEMGDGRLVPLPADWDYRLRATRAGVIVHGRDRLLVVGPDGTVQQSRLSRPAQAEWVGEDLYLFCAEGDFRHLRPSNPAPPAGPP